MASKLRSVRAKAALLAAFAALVPLPLLAQDPVPAAPQQEVVIEGVRVEGNTRQPAAVIEAEAGLPVGERLSGPAAFRLIQRAIHRLWATGQFRDVQVLADPVSPDAPDRLSLVILVEEQPFVAAIEFRGLESVSASAVRDTARLTSGTPLQPARVAAAETAVRGMLAERGIRLTGIEHRLEELEGRPGEYRLVFVVEEGQRVAISDVVFDGNQVFSNKRLREVMGTKAEGFFWFRPGTFDEEELRRDLRQRLPAFYGSHGYIDFRVWADSLIVDPDNGKARLVVAVEEGPQYRLADFTVRGNTRFPSEDLTRFFERERSGLLSSIGIGTGGQTAAQGESFDEVAFQRATERVHQLYRNQGYLYAQVEPVVERLETEAGHPAVNVRWEIREGEPAYVNRVTVAGNTRTHENVIRERLLVLPGDVYTDEAVIRSMEAISGLGFFEQLGPPDIVPNEEGDVDVTFHVEERQTGSFSFGTAVGGYSRLSGFVGFEEPNLFGQAKSGRLRWEFGQFSNNFDASYSDPAIRDSRVSGSVSLFNSRNRFISFEEGQFRRTGGSLRFGVPVPGDRWTRAFVQYSLTRTSYQQSARPSSVFSLPPGVQSTLTTGLVRSTLNHPLFPTSGTRQDLQAEFSGGPLGGHGDFQTYTAGGSWYVPMGQVGGGRAGQRPVRFTLGVTAEAGALFGDASRFPFERFWMGGVQFGRPLRGYEENTITPLGYFRRGGAPIDLEDRFGDAFVRMSAEYAVRFNENLSAAAFYDAGNLWRNPQEMNPTQLFRGAGFGVMLVTPFGPLGLDYAYGFDKDVPGWQLHFKMGQMF